MFQDFKDSLDKPAWMRIAMAVMIAVLISSLIMLGTTVRKNAYDTNIQELTGKATAATSERASLRTDINANTQALATVRADLTTVTGIVTTNHNGLEVLVTRMNASDVRVEAIEGSVAELMSPSKVYLTGTFGNYTAHAKVNEAGNYTINIYLGYSTPISLGSATNYGDAMDAFYTSINWTAAKLQDYVPTITYSGNTTSWGLVQVAFNRGTQTLAANVEAAIPVGFGGLNYTADFAYAEIWKVLE